MPLNSQARMKGVFAIFAFFTVLALAHELPGVFIAHDALLEEARAKARPATTIHELEQQFEDTSADIRRTNKGASFALREAGIGLPPSLTDLQRASDDLAKGVETEQLARVMTSIKRNVGTTMIALSEFSDNLKHHSRFDAEACGYWKAAEDSLRSTPRLHAVLADWIDRKLLLDPSDWIGEMFRETQRVLPLINERTKLCETGILSLPATSRSF